eukprot:UN30640
MIMLKEFQNVNGYDKEWSDFLQPHEMFTSENCNRGWKYWNRRIQLAENNVNENMSYVKNIIKFFGKEQCFLITSSVYGGYTNLGIDPENVEEINGSLLNVQCSTPCHTDLIPIKEIYNELNNKQVPLCKKCSNCLRPNVLLYGDYQQIHSNTNKQIKNCKNFRRRFKKMIIIEVGTDNDSALWLQTKSNFEEKVMTIFY